MIGFLFYSASKVPEPNGLARTSEEVSLTYVGHLTCIVCLGVLTCQGVGGPSELPCVWAGPVVRMWERGAIPALSAAHPKCSPAPPLGPRENRK